MDYYKKYLKYKTKYLELKKQIGGVNVDKWQLSTKMEESFETTKDKKEISWTYWVPKKGKFTTPELKYNIHITLADYGLKNEKTHVTATFDGRKIYYYPHTNTFSDVEVPVDLLDGMIESWRSFQ